VNPFATDWLALAMPIADRVRGISALRVVSPITDLSRLTTGQAVDVFPAGHIAYLGDRITANDAGARGHGSVQVVDQIWMVIIAVAHYSGGVNPAPMQAAAGPIIAQVLALLGGWQPPLTNVRPLIRIPGPAASYPTGRALYPLTYSARIIS